MRCLILTSCNPNPKTMIVKKNTFTVMRLCGRLKLMLHVIELIPILKDETKFEVVSYEYLESLVYLFVLL